MSERTRPDAYISPLMATVELIRGQMKSADNYERSERGIARFCIAPSYLNVILEAAAAKEAAEAAIASLSGALSELVALVRGECPSLLNEDSGGDARLSMAIDAVLVSLPSSPVSRPAEPSTFPDHIRPDGTGVWLAPEKGAK